MTAPPAHGGDVRGIARRYGRPVTDYIDFSANINPLGPPPAVRALIADYARGTALTQYPEPDLPELTAALARFCDVEACNVVIHGGSTALFDAILRACAPRRLGVCVPAFAEYARVAHAGSIELRTFALDLNAGAGLNIEQFCRWIGEAAIDAVIMTNPHNPLGFALPAGAVRRIVAAQPDTTFIVDEAFADYNEGVSVVREATRNSRVIVVRSLTKFFAIPDLRVGYAIMTPQRARDVAAFIPAWPVSGIAAAAATVAVGDPDFAARTRAGNMLQRARLAAGLATLGVEVQAGAANFLTFVTPGVAALCERLIVEHQIIVRDCSSFSGLPTDQYVRVAVRNEFDNDALLRALAMVLGAS